MKNKRWPIMNIVMLLALQAVLLTACSKTDAPDIESGAQSEAGAADLVEIEAPVNEETDADTGETMPEGLRPDGEYEMEESLLTQPEAEALIDPLVQWAGLYMIGRMEQRDSFDDALKLQMAAITLAYGYLPEISSEIPMAEDVDSIQYTAPEGYLYVSPDHLQAAEKFLFGETINNNTVMYAPDETGNICLNDGEGGMLVMAGDWGLEGPRGEIVSIENMGGILNMVTVSYVLYDHSEDAVTEELGWIHYFVQGTEESGQTPKIIDMNIQVLYVDQEAYLYENWKDDAVEWELDEYTLELPGDWEERAHIYQEDGGYHFICSTAASENYMGVLFTIVRMQKGMTMEVPNYVVLGEDTTGVYFAIFPSDVQVDPDDGYAAREYMNMFCYVEEILSTFQLK